MLTIYLIRHFFWPHTSNNQKAKILHTSSGALLVLVVIISQLALNYLPFFGPKVLGYAANISVQEVVRLTNEKRAQNGLPALTFNETLSQAAKAKGNDMLADDYWAHVAPDGTEPWDFFLGSGYRYRFAGENLARDFTNAGSAVEAWMASPSHRENMLSGNYREIGIAVVEGDLNGADTTLIIQFFGTKLTDTVPITPVAQVEPEATVNTPEATPAPVIAQAPNEQSEVLVSPFNVTKAFSASLVTILLFVLLIDIFAVSRRKIVRISSRSFAHLAFLGMILAILLVARAGEIL